MRLHLLALLGSLGCGEVLPLPIALELCLDGLDNEQVTDGLIDCGDPLCGELTTCVPTSSPSEAGVIVDEDDACPEGFEGGEQVIHRGLRPGACEGCGCQVGSTTCTGKLWMYADSNACFGDTGLSAGSLIGVDITSTCTSNPIYYNFSGGVRADITAQATCTSSGSAAPASSEWTETVKFCRATVAGNGCAAAHACVPKAETVAAQCVLVDGASTCGGFGDTQADWYTGADDQRTCGSCFCTAVGGDCTNVTVELGSDYTCGDFGNSVADNAQLCYSQGPYSPPARLVGASTPPVGCNAASTPAGAITPTGQQTLCCAPQG